MGEMVEANAYNVRQRSSGSYEITGGDLRTKGVHVPSDAVLKSRYEKEKRNGRLSTSLLTLIAWRGYVESHERSAKSGRLALGIGRPKLKTKNGEVDYRADWEEIVAAVDAEYPVKKVTDYLAGKEVKLPGIAEFSKKHTREWHSAHRTYGPQLGEGDGFKRVLEKLRPSLYAKLHTGKGGVKRQIDKEKLKNELISRFNSGQSIGRTALLRSDSDEERRLGNDLLLLAANRKGGYYKVLEDLTGIRKKDVEIGPKEKKLYGAIAEDLVRFLVLWGGITQTITDTIPLGLPDSLKEARLRYTYNGGTNAISDLRIGNHPIEVKAGRQKIGPKEVNDLVERYGNNKTRWSTGESFAGATIFFIKPKRTYKDAVKTLEENGITVVGQDWINSKVKQVVKIMKKDFSHSLEGLNPVADLEQIVELSDQISHRPDVLLRRANGELSQWSHDMLRALIERGYESWAA